MLTALAMDGTSVIRRALSMQEQTALAASLIAAPVTPDAAA